MKASIGSVKHIESKNRGVRRNVVVRHVVEKASMRGKIARPLIQLNRRAKHMTKRARVKRSRLGGNARAVTLTPERRQEIAKTAAAARWKRQASVDPTS